VSLACQPWDTFPESDARRLGQYQRVARPGSPFRTADGLNVTFFLDGDMPMPQSYEDVPVVQRDPKPRRMFFMAASARMGASSYQVSATRCVVTDTHIEVAVHCFEGRTCRATRLRRPTVDTRPASSTPLDVAPVLRAIRLLPSQFGTQEPSSSPLENFLRHGAELLASTTAPAAHVNMAEVAPARFSARLTLVIDAWLQLIWAHHGTVYYGYKPAAKLSAEYGFDFAHMPAHNPAKLRWVVENARCGALRPHVQPQRHGGSGALGVGLCLQSGVAGAALRQRRRSARRWPGRHISQPAHHRARYAGLRLKHDVSQSLCYAAGQWQ
jgi:hypothetical protein